MLFLPERPLMLKYVSAVVLSVVLSVGATFGLIHATIPVVEDTTRLSQATYGLTGVGGDIFSGPAAAACSAVLIQENLLLTAAHCDFAEKKVNGKEVKVVAKDEQNDLMLLSGNFPCPCVSVGEDMKKGDEITIVGFPYGLVLDFIEVHTKGIVQGFVKNSPMKGIENYAVTTAPVLPGNSGGGVFKMVDGIWYVVSIVSRGEGYTSLLPTTQSIKELLRSV